MFRAESCRRREEVERLVDEHTRELWESEERLRTLINATPDIICLKDGDGKWLEANQADLELFHLTNVDYRGKRIQSLQNIHILFSEIPF